MQNVIRRALGASIGASLAIITLTAVAGPGDGSAVVIDRPDSPDLVIQELRSENSDASHVPVKVRMTVPLGADSGGGVGSALRWAELTAYLTVTTNPKADRVSEENIQLGPEWANRSVTINIPTPGEGIYFAHVEGELYFENQTSIKLSSTSVQQVSFGKTLNCKDVKRVPFSPDRPCPVLFKRGGTTIKPGNASALATKNQKVVDAAVERIEALCASGNLHRVSVHGWASTLHSPGIPNEVLARERADAVVEALQARVPSCAAQIHGDSEEGTRAVTTKFGARKDDYDANQCAQIEITSRTCTK